MLADPTQGRQLMIHAKFRRQGELIDSVARVRCTIRLGDQVQGCEAGLKGRNRSKEASGLSIPSNRLWLIIEPCGLSAVNFERGCNTSCPPPYSERGPPRPEYRDVARTWNYLFPSRSSTCHRRKARSLKFDTMNHRNRITSPTQP